MRKSKNLPIGFWSKKGEASVNLKSAFLVLYMLYPDADENWCKLHRSENISDKISEYLQKNNPTVWGIQSKEDIASAFGQQLAWAFSSQKSIKIEYTTIYTLNKRVAKEAKEIAKNLI